MGYIPSEKCIWNDIQTLDAGNILTFFFKNNDFTHFSIKKYWHLNDFMNNKKYLNYNFEELFSIVCNDHTNADVPIGIALSGGLDSNSILHQIKKKKI